METRKKTKISLKKIFIFSFFVVSISFCPKLVFDTFASTIDYIYLDLNCGNVVINESKYSGCVYKISNGTKTSVEVKGTHSDSNNYYIYQSNGDVNQERDENGLPVYDNVIYSGLTWGEYITNHPSRSNKGDDSVDELILAWDSADKKGRVATANKVTVTTTKSNSTFNITIDNLWSTHSPKAGSADTALSFQAIGKTLRATDSQKDTYTDCATNVVVNLMVKGDNRLGRLHCATADGQNSDYISDINHTNAINISGDNDATLTVANLTENANLAHTSALIGGTDRLDHSFQINIDKITVYAGGGRLDFGSAIGGGGNGDGRVTINGGRVTAVNSSTGTALGGGCGTVGEGGYGNVTINSGEVYAYNYRPHYTSENSTSYTDAMPTAIGGGSSGTREGGIGIVNISGDADVYAYSEVGNAIGGGGGGIGSKTIDYNTYGGTADVTISGSAKVDAISGRGSSIGGGQGGGKLYSGSIPTGMFADGGTARLRIKDNPIINAGSIGGGSPLEQNRSYGASVGAAVVNISGGIIHGQIVMDGVIKNSNGIEGLTDGNSSSFTMDGGLIDNTSIGDKYGFIEENGGAVYINSGSATVKGGTIQNSSSSLGGAIYINGGNFYMSGGVIKDSTATNGGAVYVNSGNFEMSGGKMLNNSAIQGGSVYMSGGEFNLINGEFVGNKADSGGAAYVQGGNVNIHNGIFNENSASQNGGGIYLAGGSVTISDGNIENNNADVNGGGIYVASGNIIMHDGDIESNEAKNGGGFYLTKGTFEIKNGSQIVKNKATNGGGGYVSNGTFKLTGGTTTKNIATNNGGGYYIVDTPTANLTNGIISDNKATNGGGFYQTQTGDQTTSTILSGTCYVNNNTADNGNGGGIYVDGGSTFRVLNGKVIYNNATGEPSDIDTKSYVYIGDVQTAVKMTYAKDSSAGVGGGVYIKNGIFTMKNQDGSDGNAAIFGNKANYAADDLFAYGNGKTTFDAIPVTTMEKDDAYLNSTDWFEDYPKGEYHKSLKIADSSAEITSADRFKNVTSEEQLVKADSVLTTSTDYISITMGTNVGNMTLKIDDYYVGIDNTFIYTLKNSRDEEIMKISVKKERETKVVNVPIGKYSLTLNSDWSWRYTDKFSATIQKGNDKIVLEEANAISFNVTGGQTTNINAEYSIKNKSYLSKSLYTKINPIIYTSKVKEIS